MAPKKIPKKIFAGTNWFIASAGQDVDDPWDKAAMATLSKTITSHGGKIFKTVVARSLTYIVASPYDTDEFTHLTAVTVQPSFVDECIQNGALIKTKAALKKQSNDTTTGSDADEIDTQHIQPNKQVEEDDDDDINENTTSNDTTNTAKAPQTKTRSPPAAASVLDSVPASKRAKNNAKTKTNQTDGGYSDSENRPNNNTNDNDNVIIHPVTPTEAIISVDPHISRPSAWKVMRDPQGNWYDFMMEALDEYRGYTYTKMYLVQVVGDNNNNYGVFFRYGSTKKVGQTMWETANTLQGAVAIAEKKVKEKSGYSIDQLLHGTAGRPIADKYKYIKRKPEIPKLVGTGRTRR